MVMVNFTYTKTSIFTAMMLLLAAPQIASAQSSSPLSGLYACEALASNAAQLECFRAETAKLRAAGPPAGQPVVNRGSISAPERVAITEKAAEQPAIDESKKFVPLRKDVAPKTRKLAISSSTTYGSKGYLRFTLENGEIWQQMQSAHIRMGKGEPDVLTIKKASMGSSLGRVNDKRPSFRMKRIK